jgi:signal peptidase II
MSSAPPQTPAHTPGETSPDDVPGAEPWLFRPPPPPPPPADLAPFPAPVTALPLPALLPAVPSSASPESQPVPEARASTAFLVVLTVLSLIADLVTKGWAKGRLDGYDPVSHGIKRIEVWKGHIDFIFAKNPGGAWSFLRSLPDTLRRPFFLVVSAAAIVFIISIYQRVTRQQTAMKWGLPLALGGAMGNLADRIHYGWVVDFIDANAKWGGHEHHWPTFNVADIAIVLGVGLMALDMLRTRKHTDHGVAEHPPVPPAPLKADLPAAP